jgi:hypothetical protein
MTIWMELLIVGALGICVIGGVLIYWGLELIAAFNCMEDILFP